MKSLDFIRLMFYARQKFYKEYQDILTGREKNFIEVFCANLAQMYRTEVKK